MKNDQSNAKYTITFLGDVNNYKAGTSTDSKVNEALNKADSLVDQYNSQMLAKKEYEKMILSEEKMKEMKEKQKSKEQGSSNQGGRFRQIQTGQKTQFKSQQKKQKVLEKPRVNKQK